MCLTLCKTLHITSLIFMTCLHCASWFPPFDIQGNCCSERLRSSGKFTQPVRGRVRLHRPSSAYLLLSWNDQAGTGFKLLWFPLSSCPSLCFSFLFSFSSNRGKKDIAIWEFGEFFLENWKPKIRFILPLYYSCSISNLFNQKKGRAQQQQQR